MDKMLDKMLYMNDDMNDKIDTENDMNNEILFWYIYMYYIGCNVCPISSTPLNKIFTGYWILSICNFEI
jgi:hypothetical protein